MDARSTNLLQIIAPTREISSFVNLSCMKNQLLFKIESKPKMNRKNRRITKKNLWKVEFSTMLDVTYPFI